jgi:hypothetical protein
MIIKNYKKAPDETTLKCPGKLFIAVVDTEGKDFPRNIKVKIKRISSGETWSDDAKLQRGFKTVAHFSGMPADEEYEISLDDEEFTSEAKKLTVKADGGYSRGNPHVTLKPLTIKVYLKLLFKDPEGNDRIFPEDLPVQLLFDKNKKIDAVVGSEGRVYDKKGGNPFIEFARSKDTSWFKLRFNKKGDGKEKQAFIVCEKYKDATKTQKYELEDDPFKADSEIQKAIANSLRVFMLPKTEWTMETSDWSASQAPTYDDKERAFIKLNMTNVKVGDQDTPATVTLNPHWQYCRFEYFERYYGHSNHDDKPISILPITLEGYGEDVRTAQNPPIDKLMTLSNWTIGENKKKLVQVLPWILRRKVNADPAKQDCLCYPGNTSLLRFRTDEDHRFIKSTGADAREIAKLSDLPASPCADRLKFYDLPAEWRSKRYFCRLSDEADDQELFEVMVYKETTKDTPLIFSLDDMILTAQNLAPVNLRYNDPEVLANPNDRVAIFRHNFTGHAAWEQPSPPPAPPAGPAPLVPPAAPASGPAPTLDATGRPLPPDPPARPGNLPAKPQGPVPHSKRGDAASNNYWLSPNGLYKPELSRNADRPANQRHSLFPHRSKIEMKTNYIADYPYWARLLVCQSNTFDVFDKRTAFSTARTDDVVGARAAVRWVDVSTAGVGQAANTNFPNRPNLVPYNNDHPYYAIKPFTEQVYYSFTYTRAGAGADDEWTAPLAENDATLSKTGRYDMLHLRCCDFNGDKEVAVVLRHHRFSFNFNETGAGASKFKDGAYANSDAGRIQRDNERNEWTANLAKRTMDRWNGNEAPYAGQIGWVVPQDTNANKIYNKVITYLEVTDIQHAHYNLNYTDSDGSYVKCEEGTGVLEEVDNQIQGNGRLDGCHETGHTGGHPDDYIEQENHAYGQNGFGSYQMPGGPYGMAIEALMNKSKHIRSRYYWHIAEWLRTLPGYDTVKFEVKRGNNAPAGDAFKLPHYPTARTGRHFVCWPIKGKRRHSTGTCLYDSYLYMLGRDEYSTAVLPGNGVGGARVDGILVVVVKCRVRRQTWWHSIDNTKTNPIKPVLFNRMNQEIHNLLNNKVTAEFQCSNDANEERTFDRCLLHFSPRFDDRQNRGAGEHVVVGLRERHPAQATTTNYASDPKTIRVDVRRQADLASMADLNNDIARVADDYKAMFLNAVGLSTNNADANYYGNAAAYENFFRVVGAEAGTLNVNRI